MNRKLKQKLYVLYFILMANIIVFTVNYTYELNKFHHIEQTNQFRWQKNMNEEEYDQLQEGMSYMDVVRIAKGRGYQLTDQSFMWQDEVLLTQSYLITFQNDQLISKQVYNKKKQY